MSHNCCCSLTTSSAINIIAPTFSPWLRARSAPLLTASCVSVRFEKALTSCWLRLKRLKGKTDSFTLLHNHPLPDEPQQRTHVHRRHFAAISCKCLYLTMRLMSCLHSATPRNSYPGQINELGHLCDDLMTCGSTSLGNI